MEMSRWAVASHVRDGPNLESLPCRDMSFWLRRRLNSAPLGQPAISPVDTGRYVLRSDLFLSRAPTAFAFSRDQYLPFSIPHTRVYPSIASQEWGSWGGIEVRSRDLRA